MKDHARRAKLVERIIRQSWSSLDSHLPWTYLKSREGVKFHKQAIKEYLDIIATAIKLW
jgi:hypothetical protein